MHLQSGSYNHETLRKVIPQVLMVKTQVLQQILELLERMERQFIRIELQQQQILSQRQPECPIPSQWLRSKDAAKRWNVSTSTLRKYRVKRWDDGSFQWIEGVHWKKRSGYNLAIIDHWFTYRYDHQTHQDYIHQWLKASNELPAHLQKRNKGRRR
ncbi:hypothetical protein QGP82_23755 [Leptothoe sp. LEGE 181152]|nr:hypothetical protein [Leptothoe sp. LEGE 181152]